MMGVGTAVTNSLLMFSDMLDKGISFESTTDSQEVRLDYDAIMKGHLLVLFLLDSNGLDC